MNSESCVNCIQWLSACCAQPMRCALDGREEEVRAAVLLSAALGAAQVRASAACSRLRACDHSRLHGADTRRTAQGCALVQAVRAACVDGAGLGQQWPGVALLRLAASVNLISIKIPSVCLFVRAMSLRGELCSDFGAASRGSDSSSSESDFDVDVQKFLRSDWDWSAEWDDVDEEDEAWPVSVLQVYPGELVGVCETARLLPPAQTTLACHLLGRK